MGSVVALNRNRFQAKADRKGGKPPSGGPYRRTRRGARSRRGGKKRALVSAAPTDEQPIPRDVDPDIDLPKPIVGMLSRRTRLDYKFFKYLERSAARLNHGFSRLRKIRPCDKDLREGLTRRVKAYRTLRTSLHNHRRRIVEQVAVRSRCDPLVADWKLKTFLDADRKRDGWYELYGVERVDLFTGNEFLYDVIAEANRELEDPFGFRDVPAADPGGGKKTAPSKRPTRGRAPPRGKKSGKQKEPPRCRGVPKGPFCRMCGTSRRDHP